MRPIRGPALSRLRGALCVTAFAVAGSVFAASPARAADAPQHCVVILPTGTVQCFATFEEAQQLGDGGTVGPKNGRPQRTTGSASPASPRR
jgi:hypothetical protein